MYSLTCCCKIQEIQESQTIPKNLSVSRHILKDSRVNQYISLTKPYLERRAGGRNSARADLEVLQQVDVTVVVFFNYYFDHFLVNFVAY